MRRVSRKVPIILAVAWLVICGFTTMLIMKLYIGPNALSVLEYGIELCIFATVLVFSIVMMTIINITSRKSQIKWLAITSKILMIFYCVVSALFVVFVIVMQIKGFL